MVEEAQSTDVPVGGEADASPKGANGGRWGLIGLAVYLMLLVFATIGELFEVDWILDLFSL